MRSYLAYISIIVASVLAVGAVYHFTVKSNVEIVNATLTVSPKTFSLQLSPGCEVVKELKIKNSGDEREIYFEDVVEGENPDSISVYFKTPEGESITQSNKLLIQPSSEVTIHIHVKADDDARGRYSIYIMAKG